MIKEDIKIPIKVGDIILGGKWKNKKIKVKSIGTNEKGDITINNKPLMKYRIIKETKMSKYQEYLAEGKGDYEIYHDSLSMAVQEMEAYVAKNGYELDDEEMADTVGFGPKKPSGGKTNRYTVRLYKGGKEQRKAIHFQVYNRETKQNPYELNMYIR